MPLTGLPVPKKTIAAVTTDDSKQFTQGQRARTRDATRGPGANPTVLKNTHMAMRAHHYEMGRAALSNQVSQKHMAAAKAHERAMDAIYDEPGQYHRLAAEAFGRTTDLHTRHSMSGDRPDPS